MKKLILFLLALPLFCGAEEPSELVNLRASYEGAVSKAMEPLDKIFVEELRKLRESYTRNGKLEEALAVDRALKVKLGEIETTVKAPAFKNDDELREYLVAGRWYSISPGLRSGGEWIFQERGSVIGDGTRPGWSWEGEGLVLTVTFRDGNSMSFDFSEVKPSSVPGTKKSDGSIGFLTPIN